MRLFWILMFAAALPMGCADESPNRPVSNRIVFEHPATPGASKRPARPKKSWEARELEKYNLSKDSTIKEILENPNKPTLDDIINWKQLEAGNDR